MTSSTEDILASLRESYVNAFPNKIDEIETEVLALEKANDLVEKFRTLYRHVHSLKGSGGTYGLHVISTICHQFEDQLNIEEFSDKVVSSKIDTYLRYVDLLRQTATILKQGDTQFKDIEAQLSSLKKLHTPHKVSVLVIEGSMANLVIYKKTLENIDAHYVVVDDGLHALQRLLHEKFDLLITSKETKSLSGISVLAAIKADPRLAGKMKTLLITSNENIAIPSGCRPDEIIIRNSNLPSAMEAACKKMLHY